MAGELEQSSTNLAAQVSNPIYLTTWDRFSSTTRSLFAKCLGRPFGFAKADHRGAYKLLPLAPHQRRLAADTLKEPHSGDWKAIHPEAQPSRSAKAALRSICPTGIFASLATRLLEIPRARAGECSSREMGARPGGRCQRFIFWLSIRRRGLGIRISARAGALGGGEDNGRGQQMTNGANGRRGRGGRNGSRGYLRR